MMERMAGIEPAIEGWKPTALPLGYIRIIIHHSATGAGGRARSGDLHVGNVALYR